MCVLKGLLECSVVSLVPCSSLRRTTTYVSMGVVKAKNVGQGCHTPGIR